MRLKAAMIQKRYEGVMFNVISVTRGWVGIQFPEKQRYVTLEWPLSQSVLLSESDNRRENILK